MNTQFDFSILVPVGLLLLQSLLLVSLGMAALRRGRMLKSNNFSGKEGLLAGTVLFGLLIIGLSDIEGSFQAYRTYTNVGSSIVANTATRFSQFFLAVFLFAFLYGIVCWMAYRFLPGLRAGMGEEDDWGALMVYVLLVAGFALVFAFCSHEVVEQMTPQYVNFR